MNLKLFIISIAVLITFQHCKNESKTPSSKISTEIKPIELSKFKDKKFDYLITELYSFIKTLYPNCKTPKIHYKKLTKLEIKNIEEDLIFHGNLYYEKNQDSSLIDLKYDYYDFRQKNILSNYNSKDSCQFYFGGIFHSKDYKVQFIRLFQEGVNEKMDLFIREIDGEKKIIAVG